MNKKITTKHQPSNNQSSTVNRQLVIGWLYPELMNIYGDRGNIIALSKRCNWRGIKTEILELNPGFETDQLNECDVLVMGGAQDQQQTIVNKDLQRIKKTLIDKIEDGTPGLYVCGGFQFLGKYYKEADGTKIDGLGIFDLYTENPGKNHPRLIGNISVSMEDFTLVGFENHGGRTYLGSLIDELGTVIKGHGNNEKDNSEGARYKNSFGTYMHGPILPKNPELADLIIRIALERKYKNFELKELDDQLEIITKEAVLSRV